MKTTTDLLSQFRLADKAENLGKSCRSGLLYLTLYDSAIGLTVNI